ncbi:conserved hypothetical protein [Ricinus communis]|uniref:Uncharacterized protein n=1 Tax=Ricinus communis TaxID=3988 RepID=B9SKT3_RICCO|nr:conserved hypothetical protein [Ricinus communis]|eukprot:XP_002526602.1 uncharacterized protein LOC8266526 [Ricinus communis]
MQATTLLYPSPLLGSHQLSVKFLHLHPSTGFNRHHNKLCIRVHAASGRDRYRRDYDGKLIDENMVVLRKRIQEMKTAEGDNEIPSEWMDWEKKYYPDYNSDVCEAAGVLQSVLMNTRPSLALGMVALFLFTVPTSFLIIIFNLWGCISFYL